MIWFGKKILSHIAELASKDYVDEKVKKGVETALEVFDESQGLLASRLDAKHNEHERRLRVLEDGNNPRRQQRR